MTKQQFLEAAKKLNNLKLISKCTSWEEVIPEEVWDRLFPNIEMSPVAQGLHTESYREYEESTTVFQIGDFFLGMRHISSYWGKLSVSDIEYEVLFGVMDQIKVISYVPIKEQDKEHYPTKYSETLITDDNSDFELEFLLRFINTKPLFEGKVSDTSFEESLSESYEQIWDESLEISYHFLADPIKGNTALTLTSSAKYAFEFGNGFFIIEVVENL